MTPRIPGVSRANHGQAAVNRTSFVPHWRFRAWALRRPEVDTRGCDAAHEFWRATRAGRAGAYGVAQLGLPVRVGVASAVRRGVPAHAAYDVGF